MTGPVDETVADLRAKRLVERLAALIKTAPQINMNYTNATESAKWIVAEAERLGWSVTIEEPRP